MKYLLPILFFTSITLFAQNDIRKKRFFIGAFASPDLSYRLLLNNDGTNQTVAGVRDSYEIPKLGYTFGLGALYQINSRLALSIGLEYSNKGQRTKKIDLINGTQIDPRRGFITSTSTEEPVEIQYYYKVSYIDIPIRLDYYLSKRKVAPFISSGISTNIYLGEKVTSISTYSDGHKKTQESSSTDPYNTINPQFQIGAGIDIAIKRSRLRVLPIFRISLTKVHSGLNQYFYSCGLGLNYLFGL